MTASFVNSSSTTGSGVTSLSLTKPAGTQDGDLIVIVAVAWNSTISVSGFTTSDAMTGNQSANHKASVFYKVASSEPSSWTVSFGTSTWPIAAAYVLRGVTGGVAHHSAKTDASSYTTTLPAAPSTIDASTDANIYIYTGVDSAGSGTETLTMPGGLSNPITANNSALGGCLGIGWAINSSAPGSATCSPDAQDYMTSFLDLPAISVQTARNFDAIPGLGMPGTMWPDSPVLLSASTNVPAADTNGTTVENATVLVVATGAGGDSATGTDNVLNRTVSSDDPAAGADLSTVRVIATGDSGTGTDDVLTRTVKPDTDGATGTDIATVGVLPTGDSGTGTDAINTRAVPTDTDPGSGADTATVRVFDGDTGTGTDGVSTRTVVADTDPGAATDAAKVGVKPTGESGAATDSAAAFNTAIVAETGNGTDAATVRVFDGDSGAVTDAVNVRTIPTDADSGTFTDSGGVLELGADAYTGTDIATVRVFVADSGAATDLAPPPIVVSFAAESISSTDVATILVSDDDAGAATERAFVGAVGILDATLRTYLVDPDPEVDVEGDPDSRSVAFDADPLLHLGDGVVGAGSNRTVVCEVEQFANV